MDLTIAILSPLCDVIDNLPVCNQTVKESENVKLADIFVWTMSSYLMEADMKSMIKTKK